MKHRRRAFALGSLSIPALVAGAVAAPSCAPPGRTTPKVTFPADARYAEGCPAMDIAKGEYATLTVVSARHADPHMLLAACDEATLPGCQTEFCAPARRAPNSMCVSPDRSYRRLYAEPAAADGPSPGTEIVAEPFCFGGRCELSLALDVLAPGGAIVRRSACRLMAGEIRFEDDPGASPAGDDFRDLVLHCTVQRDDGSEPPHDCYPVY